MFHVAHIEHRAVVLYVERSRIDVKYFMKRAIRDISTERIECCQVSTWGSWAGWGESRRTGVAQVLREAPAVLKVRQDEVARLD